MSGPMAMLREGMASACDFGLWGLGVIRALGLGAHAMWGCVMGLVLLFLGN